MIAALRTDWSMRMRPEWRCNDPSEVTLSCSSEWDRWEKFSWLSSHWIEDLSLRALPIRKDAAWVDIPDVDTEKMLPMIDRATKARPDSRHDQAIFKSYSLGINTARDDWVCDLDRTNLLEKVKYSIRKYNSAETDSNIFTSKIKWSRNLKRRLAQGRRQSWSQEHVVTAMCRP